MVQIELELSPMEGYNSRVYKKGLTGVKKQQLKD
jgi:hypothetical protein